MLLAHLVSARYGRSREDEPYAKGAPARGWFARLVALIFGKH